MKRQFIIILFLALFLSCQPLKTARAQSSEQNEDNLVDPDNYCHDQKGWKEWDNLVNRYPNGRDLQALHALRIGLCTKIDQGSIRIEDAIDIFEQAHQRVIEKAKKERETDQKPSL